MLGYDSFKELDSSEKRLTFTRFTITRGTGFADDSVTYDGTEIVICEFDNCAATLSTLVTASATDINAGMTSDQTGGFGYYTNDTGGTVHVNVISLAGGSPVAVPVPTPRLGNSDPDPEPKGNSIPTPTPGPGPGLKMLFVEAGKEPQPLWHCTRGATWSDSVPATDPWTLGGDTSGLLPIGDYDPRFGGNGLYAMVQRLNWNGLYAMVQRLNWNGPSLPQWHVVFVQFDPLAEVDLTYLAEQAAGKAFGDYLWMLPDVSADNAAIIMNYVDITTADRGTQTVKWMPLAWLPRAPWIPTPGRF